MGPRFFNRGRIVALSRLRRARRASMGPRFFNRGRRRRQNKHRKGQKPLQWGLGFSTEEGFAIDSPSNYCKSCFNGASVFQPRKVEKLQGVALAYEASFNGASVFQPRKGSSLTLDWLRPPSFNGASVFQPRKVPDQSAPILPAASFNGASVFQPRKEIAQGAEGAQ